MKKITRKTSRRDAPLQQWFANKNWKAAAFQRDAWAHFLQGYSGVVNAPTGSGKTLAVLGGPLIEWLEQYAKNAKRFSNYSIQILWVTPLKALATDTHRAINEIVNELNLPVTVTLRTGDSSAKEKRQAKAGKCHILITTPESLALLLGYKNSADNFNHLQTVVVDEWHELLGNKRGVLLQLNLTRLKSINPGLRLWGLSATLGNLPEACDALLFGFTQQTLIKADGIRPVTLTSLLPSEKSRLPWSGHLGLARLPEVFTQIFEAPTTIIFTNTRAFAELWYRALASVWPEAPETLALHHGSLDQSLRKKVEEGLRQGSLRCAVATSSLDLGVDFPAVDQVIQIGSPKSVARLVQRAGRAKHRPNTSGEIFCVPTQAIELLEYAATRTAISEQKIESRTPLKNCLDVLAQHAVSMALSYEFTADELFNEIKNCHAYAELTQKDFISVLRFIESGGQALTHYPGFHRVERGEDNRYRVVSKRIALRHRLGIGTIMSDGAISIKLLRGGYLGNLDESFMSKLAPRDVFHFAGRSLELVHLDHMTAQVKLSKKKGGPVASWQGSRLPLAYELAQDIARIFSYKDNHSPERNRLLPLIDLQEKTSGLPNPSQVLLENIKTQRHYHLAIYPFAGRQIHEGLAGIIALRLARLTPTSFHFTCNDYGFLLTSPTKILISADVIPDLFSLNNLLEDIHECNNLTELAKRQFREIARISGLLTPSPPGQGSRSLRQLQASSGLIFDVLSRYDPEHILLQQAHNEVLTHVLSLRDLTKTLQALQKKSYLLTLPTWLTPLSFPLWADSLRGHLSTETWQTRVKREAEKLEKRYERKNY